MTLKLAQGKQRKKPDSHHKIPPSLRNWQKKILQEVEVKIKAKLKRICFMCLRSRCPFLCSEREKDWDWFSGEGKGVGLQIEGHWTRLRPGGVPHENGKWTRMHPGRWHPLPPAPIAVLASQVPEDLLHGMWPPQEERPENTFTRDYLTKCPGQIALQRSAQSTSTTHVFRAWLFVPHSYVYKQVSKAHQTSRETSTLKIKTKTNKQGNLEKTELHGKQKTWKRRNFHWYFKGR